MQINLLDEFNFKSSVEKLSQTLRYIYFFFFLLALSEYNRSFEKNGTGSIVE
jgi:hypothetical protein